jgi:uncharacterized membrane protein YccC
MSAGILRRLQWARGLRASAAVGIAMLASHALNLPPAAAALGAFNPLLVDNGGPYRTRLTTMLTTMLGGAAAYIAGALVPQHVAAIVACTMIAAFAITLARVFNQQLASSSVLILILYFAGVGGTLHTLRGAALAAALVLLGGVWSVAISLVFWPLDPFRPARQSVAGCYGWMSGFTAALAATSAEVAVEAETADPGFEWRRQQRVRLEDARATLSGTAARAPSRTVRFRNLTVLLETSDMLLARTMRLVELKATAARLNLPRSFALAGEIANWLAAAEQAVANALEARPADAAASFAPEGSLRLEFVARRHRALSVRQPPRGDAVYPHLLREERDALLEVEVIFDAVRALWTGLETPSSNFASAFHREAKPRWFESAEANWTFESAAMRHALRMTLVCAVDVVAMHLIHVNHGFWLPMTSIILLQPFSAGTVRKSVQRVTGTIAGGILAAILAAVIPTPLIMLCIVTGLAALTVASFAIDYAVYCLFLTPTFVLLSLPHARDWQYAFVRIFTTLAGALIAVLAMRLLWPERAEVELGQLMRRSAAAAANYLQAMLDFWSFDPFDPTARAVGERRLLAPGRRACGLASNDAEEAVDRVLQEPAFGRRNDAESRLRNDALTFVTYLRRLTQSITTLALIGKDSADSRARLAPIARRLQRLATGLPILLDAGTVADESDASMQFDLVEEQMQRIERQTAVLERSIKGVLPVEAARPS